MVLVPADPMRTSSSNLDRTNNRYQVKKTMKEDHYLNDIGLQTLIGFAAIAMAIGSLVLAVTDSRMTGMLAFLAFGVIFSEVAMSALRNIRRAKRLTKEKQK